MFSDFIDSQKYVFKISASLLSSDKIVSPSEMLIFLPKLPLSDKNGFTVF